MIEFISNVIGILSDKQADVIIAIIGLMSAAVVSIIGLFGSALTLVKQEKRTKSRTQEN